MAKSDLSVDFDPREQTREKLLASYLASYLARLSTNRHGCAIYRYEDILLNGRLQKD